MPDTRSNSTHVVAALNTEMSHKRNIIYNSVKYKKHNDQILQN
jgi:hypothetical protein